MKNNIELIQLYREMADLTLAECRQCKIPLGCCSPEYCDMALSWAKDKWGICLQKTNHPILPFMGESGCTVAPHLRPWCTLHTCEMNAMGIKKDDTEWTEKYFELRYRIEELEYNRND